jgi:hypothetical protein
MAEGCNFDTDLGIILGYFHNGMVDNFLEHMINLMDMVI